MGDSRVLSIGNTVLDVIGKTPDHLPRFGELAAGRGPADIDIGGNGAIAAAAASVLGADASLASTIGDDAWGRWLRENLDKLGVDTAQLVTVRDQPTATTLSLVRTDGERALLTHNGASEGHDLARVDLDAVGEGDWVIISSLFLVRAYTGDAVRRIAREARAKGARVMMDLAWDCTGEWDLGLLPLDEADIVVANHMEIRAVACRSDLDDAIPKVMDAGIRALVVKMGDEGARIVTADGVDVTVPAFDVVPINSTGTGDVFNAALVVALAGGRDLERAVTFACAAGALRVSGGCHTFPTFKDVETLIESRT
jgi:sugar/nucleoside kinase (ribokinase family)